MATASGGLSCDVKGVSSPHSKTASTSEGSSVGAWNWTCLFFRVWYPYFSTKPGSIETNPTLVVEVSNVKLISI